MKFIVETENKDPNQKKCFIAEIKTMVGDGESYKIFTIGRFKGNCRETKRVMTDLVETLDRMIEKYPNRKRGCDSYKDVEGFQRWFMGIIDDFYKGLSGVGQAFYEEYSWPCDTYGNQNSIVSYKFYYYDSFGNKRNVKIIK